jgi:hypothetical protein
MCKACSGGAVVDDAQAAAILERIRAALDPLGVSISEGVRIHCKVCMGYLGISGFIQVLQGLLQGGGYILEL